MACSSCGEEGHNARTCARDDDEHFVPTVSDFRSLSKRDRATVIELIASDEGLQKVYVHRTLDDAHGNTRLATLFPNFRLTDDDAGITVASEVSPTLSPAPELDKTFLREHDPRCDGSLPRDLLVLIEELTSGGRDRFKIGITCRPGRRRGGYAGEGYGYMHVLRRHAKHRTIHGLEKRLIEYGKRAGWSIDNSSASTPQGPVAEFYRNYYLYIVR